MQWPRFIVGFLLVAAGIIIGGTVSTILGVIVLIVGLIVMSTTALTGFGGQ